MKIRETAVRLQISAVISDLLKDRVRRFSSACGRQSGAAGDNQGRVISSPPIMERLKTDWAPTGPKRTTVV